VYDSNFLGTALILNQPATIKHNIAYGPIFVKRYFLSVVAGENVRFVQRSETRCDGCRGVLEQEQFSVSRWQHEWLRVLHEVGVGHLTQVEEAKRIRLTTRHVRRQGRRAEEKEDRVAGPRATRPRVELEDQPQDRAARPVRVRWHDADFVPTLASQRLDPGSAHINSNPPIGKALPGKGRRT